MSENFDKSPFEQEIGIKGIWLPELMYQIRSRWLKTSELLCFAIVFLTLPLIMLAPFFLTGIINGGYGFDGIRRVCLLLAASWTLIGPWFINEHSKRIVGLHKYLRQETNIDESEINQYFLESCKKYKKNIALFTLPWTILVLTPLVLFPESMIPYGFSGVFDYNYIMLLLYLAFILHLNVIGLSGCVMSVKTVHHFSSEAVLIKNILINDKNGMKKFGDFIFWTSIYFASGLLYFPILIDYMRTNHFGESLLVLIPIAIMVCVLMGTFALPNLWIKKIAESEKAKLVSTIRGTYHEKMQSYCSMEFKDHIEMINLYNYMDFLNGIDISPSEFKKVITIIASGILPLILYIIDNWDFIQTLFTEYIN